MKQKQKVLFTETLKKVQELQTKCLGTNVGFQVQVRKFTDGDYGILVTINRLESDDFPMFNLYTCDKAKERRVFLNGIERTLREYGL